MKRHKQKEAGLESHKITLVTKCLWELQEMSHEIDGLILIGLDGFVIASTLSPTPSTTRVAAVSSALVELAKKVMQEWDRGDFSEVRVTYRDQAGQRRDAQLIPIHDYAILAVLLRNVATLSLATVIVPHNTRKAIQYIRRVVEEDTPPAEPIEWMWG